MRVCDQRCNTFRRTRAPNHPHPLLHTTLSLRPRGELFQPLVQHPLDCPLRHAQIARAQPLIEPAHALVPQNLLDHRDGPPKERLPARPSELRLVCVELEARLDDPDRVRRGAGRDAGDGRGGEVHPRVLLTVVEGVGDDLLAVAVREEVDGPCGDDADEGGPEALEQRARRLLAVDVPASALRMSIGVACWMMQMEMGRWGRDVPDDMRRLDEVPEQVPADGDGGGAVGLYANVYMLHAEHVRL